MRVVIPKEKINIFTNRKHLVNILAILSSLIFTFVLSINFAVYIPYEGYSASDYEVKIYYAIISIIIMIPIYVYLFVKKDFLFCLLNQISVCEVGFSLFIGFFTLLQLKHDTEKNLSHVISVLKLEDTLIQSEMTHIIIWIICTATVFSLVIFISYVINTISKWYTAFAKDFSQEEIVYIIISLFFGISVICYFYTRTWAGWGSGDLVYQIDACFVYNNYYPVFSYGFDFDWDIGIGGVRHPLATMIMFPVHILVAIISNICFWIPNLRAILYACVQLMLMTFSVIMIKRIVNSKWTYALSILSFPFILYTIFIEKYPVVLFFVVLYVYTTVKDKNLQIQKYSLIASGGMMITTALLGLLYGQSNRFKKRIAEYVDAILLFIFVLIGSGRIHYILDFYRLLHQNSVMFYENTRIYYGIKEKFFGFTNLCASSLIPVAYQGTETNFYWVHLTDKINYFGLIIIILCIYTSIKYRKNITIRPFIVWFIFSIVQFVIIGFGTGFEPLFSLCYSWAFIPLIILGINDLIKKERIRTAVYICLSLVMFYLNYIHYEELLHYLIVKAPI